MKKAELTGTEAPIHTPRAVSTITGLSAHVLRAWERRYAAVTPSRTAGGARRYSTAQVDRLLALCRAIRAGHTIGAIANLSDDDLSRLIPPQAEEGALDLDAMTDAANRLDTRGLRRALGVQLAALGTRQFAVSVAGPLLARIGTMWAYGNASIAAEHLATREVRALLEASLRSGAGGRSGSGIVFASPAGEHHDTGLLIAAATASDLDIEMTILGADLPAREIAEATKTTGATALVLSLVCLDADQARREVRELREHTAEHIEIVAGGANAIDLGIPRVQFVPNFEAFADWAQQRTRRES